MTAVSDAAAVLSAPFAPIRETGGLMLLPSGTFFDYKAMIITYALSISSRPRAVCILI
jgi:hypothetical protein